MSAHSPRDDQQQPLDSVESPGKRLRIARQAKGMSQNDVASHLHLSSSIIQALENDDHEGMPGPVFVRGYIRNYARLLGLDDSAVVGSFTQGQSDQPQRPAPIRSGVQPEIRSSHFAVRLVSWLIVIGLVGLIGAWWQGHLKWNSEELDQAAEPAAPEPLSEDGTLRLPEPEPDQAPEQLPQIAKSLEQPPHSAATEEGSMQEAPQDTQKPAPDTGDDAAPDPVPGAEAGSPPASPPEPEVASAATVAVQPPEPESSDVEEAEQNQIVFEFTGPCWVDIRDASRKFKIFGEMDKGDRKVLEGSPPYSVILGNSSNVRVAVNGQPYDVAPHSRGRVARFTLDPGTAE